jgi:hypothetical protein
MGAIKGLDRIRFRGTLRWLANEYGMSTFLSSRGILYKDFKTWAEGLTASIRDSCSQHAERLGIAVQYLRSGAIDKEKLARQIAEDRGITTGPICLFSVVEQCISPTVKGNKSTKQLELKMVPRKCIWLYHYFNDPEFGFGHVRLQSWLPFNIFICLNGRHWLERQLLNHNISYTKDGNCFPWIADIKSAQELLDKQLKTNWSEMLNSLVNTAYSDLYSLLPLDPYYYWSADETEWSTDIMFKSRKDLDRLYPSMIHYAMNVSDSPTVMRYLGRRENRGAMPEEIVSDYRRRYEGVRVKHWKSGNSVKMYNKSGSILRIETTITNPRDFKVYRHPDDDVTRPASWQKMRKGVSDLYRRCQVSDKSNERYADALAAGQVEERLKEVVSGACNSTKSKGKRYRGLNPLQEEDYKLLTFLAKGEHAVAGFRNKDLKVWLYPDSERLEKEMQKRYSGRTTRRIKLLRVHGLIKKVAKENRYALTTKGKKFAVALMTALSADINKLTNIAA